MGIAKRFENFIKFDLKNKLEKAIIQWAAKVEEDAKSIVPQRTGALKESYDLEIVKDSNQILATLQFGRGLTGFNGENYAAQVHEWPEDKDWNTLGTGPRFLERAKMNNLSSLLPQIKRSVKI